MNNDKHDLPSLTVKEIMITSVVTVFPEMTMGEAKEIMRLKNITGMPVIDKNRKLIGVVSIADVFQALDEHKLDAPIRERMTVKVHSVKPEDSISVALSLFRRYQFGRLPVVDDGNTLVGLITPKEVIAGLAAFLKLEEINEGDLGTKSGSEINRTLEFHLQGGNFDQAGIAASTLKKTLQEIGIRPEIIRKVAIATYEAEMNVVIHADEGILKAVITADKLKISVNDRGPGIANIEEAMQVGFSTAPDKIREMGFGAGMGLPNIKKSSDYFKIDSLPGKGTDLYIEINF